MGDFAKGIDNGLIDLVFVGDNINKNYLLKIVGKAEDMVSRKIRYMLFSKDEIISFIDSKKDSDYLLLWENGQKN